MRSSGGSGGSPAVLSYLNSALSARGPAALPYVEELKWTIREHVVQLLAVRPYWRVCAAAERRLVCRASRRCRPPPRTSHTTTGAPRTCCACRARCPSTSRRALRSAVALAFARLTWTPASSHAPALPGRQVQHPRLLLAARGVPPVGAAMLCDAHGRDGCQARARVCGGVRPRVGALPAALDVPQPHAGGRGWTAGGGLRARPAVVQQATLWSRRSAAVAAVTAAAAAARDLELAARRWARCGFFRGWGCGAAGALGGGATAGGFGAGCAAAEGARARARARACACAARGAAVRSALAACITAAGAACLPFPSSAPPTTDPRPACESLPPRPSSRPTRTAAGALRPAPRVCVSREGALGVDPPLARVPGRRRGC